MDEFGTAPPNKCAATPGADTTRNCSACGTMNTAHHCVCVGCAALPGSPTALPGARICPGCRLIFQTERCPNYRHNCRTTRTCGSDPANEPRHAHIVLARLSVADPPPTRTAGARPSGWPDPSLRAPALTR